MADMPDESALISEFCSLTGASTEKANQYLRAHSWDILSASNAYFDGDEPKAEEAAQTPSDTYTGPRTLDGRPAPQAASSRPPRKSAAQLKKKGIATLGSLGGDAHADDDDDSDTDIDDDEDDDGRGNLFAGGEKSGLAVQDPKQDGGGPKKIIGDILAKARQNTTRPGADDADAGPSRQSYFRGTGMTLGGEGTESRSIPDPLGSMRSSSSAEHQERILHIWQDGFSIDDGELRRFDDPNNVADLQLIRQGRAPLHLMNVTHDAPVDVKLQQHDHPYQPQPKKYKPFGGEGHRLGAPVPGDGGEATAASTSTSTSTAAAAAPAAGPSNTSVHGFDESQPSVTIRIQLPDGTRVPARFNTTHTIGSVYGFVQVAYPETRSRSWVLATTFPNKEHTEEDAVLGEMPEFKKGGTAVVKWT